MSYGADADAPVAQGTSYVNDVTTERRTATP